MGNASGNSGAKESTAEKQVLNGSVVRYGEKPNGVVVASKAARSIADEFIVHGLDYLPEFEKKRERRRKNVPKFLRIDSLNWTNGYLHFLSRSLGSKSTIKSETGLSNGHSERMANGSIIIENQRMSRTATMDICLEEEEDEWLTYADYPFQNVVMSGGGSKGYAYIGSLKALEDCGILRNVKRIAGCSAGAICAGLLAVGCSPQEIADVFKCDIKWLFHDQTCTCCCCLPRVCHKYGVHPAKRFYEIYGEHIARKVGSPDITFKELQDRYGRELRIVVTNLSRMCSEYCTPVTSPDLPIRDAVRMSMAFPLVFRAVRSNLTGRDCLYTDGGLLDQYPIHSFDEEEVEVNHNKELTESTDECNRKTLGLYVVSEKAIDYKIWQTLFGKEIPYKPTYLPNTKLARARLKQEMMIRKRQNKHFSKKEYMDELRASVGDNAVQVWDHYEVVNKSHVDISNFGEYFITAIETLLISQRKLRVKPGDVSRTVAINCGYIGTNDYVIEPGDREFMINQGYACTRRFLQEYIVKTRRSPRHQSPASHVTIPTSEIDATSEIGLTFESGPSSGPASGTDGLEAVACSWSAQPMTVQENSFYSSAAIAQSTAECPTNVTTELPLTLATLESSVAESNV